MHNTDDGSTNWDRQVADIMRTLTALIPNHSVDAIVFATARFVGLLAAGAQDLPDQPTTFDQRLAQVQTVMRSAYDAARNEGISVVQKQAH